MNAVKKIILAFILLIGVQACKTQNTQISSQTEVIVSVDQPKSVNVHGERFHYIEKGTGKPIIFIHGGLGDYRIWINRMEPYSKKHHVIAYSRRYAWPSKQIFDESADYSVRPHAKDLYALIQGLGLKKVDLIGHSYGAFTALAFALDHPEMVQSLVLGEPPVISLLENVEGGEQRHQAFLQNALEPAAESFRDNKNEEGVAKFIGGVNGESFSWAEVPEEIKKEWMDNLPEIWGYALTDTFVPIKRGKIKAFEVPTLLFVGDRSPQFLIDISEELDRLLPNSQLKVLENSSHGLMFHNPEDFDRLTMQFLGEH